MESGGQAGGETGGGPHRLRRSRTDFSPGVSGKGSAEARIRHSAPPSAAARRREAQGPFQAPQRRGLALWSPRKGTGAGQPVERGRDAYAGRDIPCAPLSKGTLPHGLAALTVRQHALPGPAPAPPPARLARRPADPVNRRSSVGGPTKSDPPARPEVQASGPLRAFLPAAARGRAFPGRRPGEDMEAFASKRASDPSGGPFPALCAAEGPLPRRGPLLPIRAQTRPVRRENGGRRVREAAKRLPPGAARREKTVRQTGSFQSPHRLCPRRYPRKAAPTGAKRPPACIRETPRPGAERRSIGG